jgi:hypothetical protein
MTAYLLSTDTYIGVEGNQLIILDLSSGNYLGVEIPPMLDVGNHISGFPARALPVPGNDSADESAFSESMRGLAGRGILTDDPARGRPATSIRYETPSEYLLDLPLEGSPTVLFRHVRDFFSAVASTTFLLRFVPLRDTVYRVRQRKQAALALHTHIDTAKLLELVTIFNNLRPLAFARPNQCLFHSLALLEFLASFGMFPDWLFGARSHPFRAHSWLQTGGFCITDSLISIAGFVPLLVV